MIRMLLQLGADWSICDIEGKSSLSYADTSLIESVHDLSLKMGRLPGLTYLHTFACSTNLYLLSPIEFLFLLNFLSPLTSLLLCFATATFLLLP
eukprot:768258-Hanusia_phi.AAC.3